VDFLIEFDRWLFRLINDGMANAFFDAVLPWCRERLFWAPFYVFVVAFGWLNWGLKRGTFVLLAMLLTLGLADFTSSTLIKKNVQRLRPCNDPTQQVQLRLEHCGGGYSFTSSHATNHFAIATLLIAVLGGYHRRIRVGLLAWAGTIAFAQVYVGVHYPFDVICGALLGILLGKLVALWLKRIITFEPTTA
jgi:membrane-associated phospholipid phosphatase